MAVADLIRRHPTGQLSHDDMELAIGYDRRSIITVLKHLERDGIIQIERGKGRQPNKYRFSN